MNNPKTFFQKSISTGALTYVQCFSHLYNLFFRSTPRVPPPPQKDEVEDDKEDKEGDEDEEKEMKKRKKDMKKEEKEEEEEDEEDSFLLYYFSCLCLFYVYVFAAHQRCC